MIYTRLKIQNYESNFDTLQRESFELATKHTLDQISTWSRYKNKPTEKCSFEEYYKNHPSDKIELLLLYCACPKCSPRC